MRGTHKPGSRDKDGLWDTILPSFVVDRKKKKIENGVLDIKLLENGILDLKKRTLCRKWLGNGRVKGKLP